MNASRVLLPLLALFVLVVVRDVRAISQDATERVSVTTSEAQGNGPSPVIYGPAISDMGRFVAFETDATNLGTGDGATDIVVRDRTLGTTTIMNLTASGADVPLFGAYFPHLAPSGRFIAFTSQANGLVPGDNDYQLDVFVRDRDADQDGIFDEVAQSNPPGVTLTLANAPEAGGADDHVNVYATISGTGRYATFYSYSQLVATDTSTCLLPAVPEIDPGDYAGETTRCPDVYVRDLVAGRTVLISASPSGQSNGRSIEPFISANGRYVTFYSNATNLVADDDVEHNTDVFVVDGEETDNDGLYWETPPWTVTRMSVSTDGDGGTEESEEPVISADGRFVAFESDADYLVPGDNNEATDVFVRDRDTDRDSIFDEVNGVETTRVSLARGALPSGAFHTAVIEGDGDSNAPSISGDGRFIAFESKATNLSEVDTDGNGICDELCDENAAGDVFVHDRGNGLTERVSLDNSGFETSAGGEHPAMSPSGQYVAFSSISPLVTGDTNSVSDVFTRTFDPDDDDDRVFDGDEFACGSDPSSAASRPERLDGIFATVDDDGNDGADEALPAWARRYDCDGDGFVGSVENSTPLCTNTVNDDSFDDAVANDGCPGGPSQVGGYSEATFNIGTNDQDPCGLSAWPADLRSGGIPDSTNKVNILDITSFLGPIRRLDTSPNDAGFDQRWDLIPGGSPKFINISDMNLLVTLYPPMLPGKAFNATCPWNP